MADRVAEYARDGQARARLVARAFEHALTLTWQRTAQGYLNLWRAKRETAAAPRGWLERATLALRLGVELRGP